MDEFPGITAQGYSNLGNNNGPYYSSNQTNYNFSGSILRVIGKHSLSFGGEHRDYFLAFFQTNPLLMNFANDMTQGPDPLTVSAASRRWRRIACSWERAQAAVRATMPGRRTPITTSVSSFRTTSSGRAS